MDPVSITLGAVPIALDLATRLYSLLEKYQENSEGCQDLAETVKGIKKDLTWLYRQTRRHREFLEQDVRNLEKRLRECEKFLDKFGEKSFIIFKLAHASGDNKKIQLLNERLKQTYMELQGKMKITLSTSHVQQTELIIDSLKAMHKFNQQNQSKKSLSTLPSENNKFDRIKDKYERHSRIQRIKNPGKSFSIEESYISLTLVKTKEHQEKEKKLRYAQQYDEVIKSFEEIYGMKTSVETKDIFESCKDQTKQVLVFGRAGIGKSTFCQYITYQWAKGEILSQYHLVVFIQLNLLTSDRYPSGDRYLPVHLVEKEYFQYDDLSEGDRQHFKEQCDKGHVLWVLDGYDEFVENIPEQLKDVFDQVRTTQHHILTSRSYPIGLSYDVEMELVGFTDDNIEDYVEKFFDHIEDTSKDCSSEGRKLLQLLKLNPNLWGVAHVPINLELICSYWGDTHNSNSQTLTMTEIHNDMAQWLWRRYLTKQNVENAYMDEEKLSTYCSKEMAFLESLAFFAMEANSIILGAELLRKAETKSKYLSENYRQVLNTGFLKPMNDKPVGSYVRTEIGYYFIHISFQEYFAAQYLVKAIKSSTPQEAVDFINGQKYNERFTSVFAFTFGLIRQLHCQKLIDTFWSTICKEPRDLCHFRHIQGIIAYIEEMSDWSDFGDHKQYINSILQWMKISVSMKQTVLTDRITRSLQRTVLLVNDGVIQKTLTELLKSKDNITKLNTSSMISRLTISNAEPQLISQLLQTLDDADAESEVKQNVCEALGNIGENAAIKDVIDGLKKAFKDDESDVRCKACEALGNIGKNSANSDVLDALVKALKDRTSDVRCSACEALGNVGKKAADSDVMNGLVKALEDDESDVRWKACEALGNIGEKAANNHVVDKLLGALADTDSNVRWKACEALDNIGENTAVKNVINGFVEELKLKQDDSKARYNACEVLGNIGEHAANDEVLDALVKALKDDESDVRWKACEALGNICENAANDEVLDALVKALDDNESDVRCKACEALGNIGENAANDEVLDALVKALKDPNPDVRCNACEALGNMDEKAAKNDVINGLVEVLEDDKSDVRWKACEALGNIGEKAAGNDVIDGLVKALKDDESDIRWKACEALGNICEKPVSNNVIIELMEVLEHDNPNVRWKACEALGTIGESTADNDVIGALVKRLKDVDPDVKWKVCEALGNMGEKAARDHVLDALVKALEDNESDVRWKACEALGNIGENAANDEVLDALVKALKDRNTDVRCNACAALGNMGEKAARADVINGLMMAVEDASSNMDEPVAELLDITFQSRCGIGQLDYEMVSKLDSCIRRNRAISLRNVPSDRFVELFLKTEKSCWLPIATYAMLLQGNALTVTHDKIVIYGSNEPVEIKDRPKLIRKLRSAFVDEKKRLEECSLSPNRSGTKWCMYL